MTPSAPDTLLSTFCVHSKPPRASIGGPSRGGPRPLGFRAKTGDGVEPSVEPYGATAMRNPPWVPWLRRCVGDFVIKAARSYDPVPRGSFPQPAWVRQVYPAPGTVDYSRPCAPSGRTSVRLPRDRLKSADPGARWQGQRWGALWALVLHLHQDCAMKSRSMCLIHSAYSA